MINPVLLWVKIVQMYAFLVYNIFGPKLWSCKNFDKFQVWAWQGHLDTHKACQSLEVHSINMLIQTDEHFDINRSTLAV